MNKKKKNLDKLKNRQTLNQKMKSQSLNQNKNPLRKSQLWFYQKRRLQGLDRPNQLSYLAMYLVQLIDAMGWHVSMMETATVAAVLSLSLANKRGACLSSTEICALLLSMLLNTRFKKTDLR